MASTTASPPMNKNTVLLRPLQTPGRTRENHVEAQVLGLLACSLAEFRQRAACIDKASPLWACEEALVCVLRQWNRCGRQEDAWQIAEILLKRTAYFITQNVRVWTSLSPMQAEDCIQDVQSQMLHDMMSDSRACEFWEIRFWLCLKRRLLNQVQKYRTVAESELHLQPIEDGEGNASDPFERMTSQDGQPSTMPIEIAQALTQLSEQERTAFVLFHRERWPQQDIAAHMQVTDRTVRNLLRRAEDRLKTWREKDLH